MDHKDHVNLLRPANFTQENASWADLGAGSGAFTVALRELIGPTANIYAVDKDRASLNQLQRDHQIRFEDSNNLHLVVGDFSRALSLPPLDGILMANSLHFFKDKVKVLEHVKSFLKPKGTLILVEYNVDKGNLWVPYPFTFSTFGKLAKQSGFAEPRQLATAPSSFLHGFYSTITNKID
ncbi:MAG: class I SAM-dependent methyltransferase [Anaerolineales bacterium]|nr:class I SAM-dependent methyltransferase [Anaerolineales bacterium]